MPAQTCAPNVSLQAVVRRCWYPFPFLCMCLFPSFFFFFPATRTPHRLAQQSTLPVLRSARARELDKRRRESSDGGRDE